MSLKKHITLWEANEMCQQRTDHAKRSGSEMGRRKTEEMKIKIQENRSPLVCGWLWWDCHALLGALARVHKHKKTEFGYTIRQVRATGKKRRAIKEVSERANARRKKHEEQKTLKPCPSVSHVKQKSGSGKWTQKQKTIHVRDSKMDF